MINIEGLDATLENFKSFGDKVMKAVAMEARASAETIARNAKRKAPANYGALRRGITVNQIDEVTFEVVSSVDYSAYVEFGTKSQVQVPQEFAAIAEAARGSGRIGQLNAREAIFNWCKAKGIKQSLWWPIYVSIMTYGIKPHPFLSNSFNDEKPNYDARIQKIIEKG